MEENRIPRRVLCMNSETTRLRGRPRKRWQDEVRDNGRIVGGRKKYRISWPTRRTVIFSLEISEKKEKITMNVF
jgi:hypothetical protein